MLPLSLVRSIFRQSIMMQVGLSNDNLGIYVPRYSDWSIIRQWNQVCQPLLLCLKILQLPSCQQLLIRILSNIDQFWIRHLDDKIMELAVELINLILIMLHFHHNIIVVYILRWVLIRARLVPQHKFQAGLHIFIHLQKQTASITIRACQDVFLIFNGSVIVIWVEPGIYLNKLLQNRTINSLEYQNNETKVLVK
jgi:hypothetical protein